LVALETKILSGQIKLSVHDQIKWLHPRDVLALKLAPADIPIAQVLAEEADPLLGQG
jgi:8-oxo-dGTP diphosphatase